jgi:hypothetical protein
VFLALGLLPATATPAAAGWFPNAQLLLQSAPSLLEPVASADLVPVWETDVEEEDASELAAAEVPAIGARNQHWTPVDVLAMRNQASPRARCVIDHEVGGFGYDPWRRGMAGERGPVQLHPRGLLGEFLAWSGGQAPENPYWAVPFLELKLRQGQGRAWTSVLRGVC